MNSSERRLAVLVWLLLVATSSCASARPRTVDPVLLQLAGPVAERRAEVSGLTWMGDTLAVLPQFPDIFGPEDVLGFFAVSKDEILAAVADPAGVAVEPRMIECTSPGLLRIVRGFDGLEAMGIAGDVCYLTAEAKEDTAMAGYLVSGRYHFAAGKATIDLTHLSSIPLGLNVPNIAEESLVIDGRRVLTFSEANGRNVNPEPRAKVFDLDLQYQGSLPFPAIEYRVTDATALDADGRFWVMNYFFPPDGEVLQPAPDPEVARFGAPEGFDPGGCIERLLELQLTPEGIVRTDTPPLWLELQPDGECRNWEALVRLDDRGFLIMTDKYPATLLAFVPYPREIQP